MTKHTERYNLTTAIAMIVGICIGSGIFFKSDNILIATNGSIALGILLFVVAAIAIIFGGLTIGTLAQKTNQPGGIITYAQEFVSSKFACGLGWFMTFVYYPTVTAVVSWVIGIYVDILFNLNLSLELQILIGFVFATICYLYNVFYPKFGAYFQNSTTFIKLIPLFVLGLLGFLYGDPIAGIANLSSSELTSVGWLSALGPIAYAFDGWIVSTSLAHEIKDSKRNLPLALMIAPLIVLFIYILYFVGLSTYLGPETIMQLEDAHLTLAAEQLLGTTFAKAITVFVIISVMGTVNGLITGFIRMPYLMSLRKGMFFAEEKHSHLSGKHNIPLQSAITSFIIYSIWLAVHYIFTKNQILGNSDVSEIAISSAYIFYSILYFKVLIMYKNKEVEGIFKGCICPIFGLLGSVIILTGAVQNKFFILYLLFTILLYCFSQVFYHKKIYK